MFKKAILFLSLLAIIVSIFTYVQDNHIFGYSKKDMTAILTANRDLFDRVTTFITDQYVEGDFGYAIEGNKYLTEGPFMEVSSKAISRIYNTQIEIEESQLQKDFRTLFETLNFTSIGTRFTSTGEVTIYFTIQQGHSPYYFYWLAYTTNPKYGAEIYNLEDYHIEDHWYYSYNVLDELG